MRYYLLIRNNKRDISWINKILFYIKICFTAINLSDKYFDSEQTILFIQDVTNGCT